jgi:tetratricopeptide (TPR) repeat protein
MRRFGLAIAVSLVLASACKVGNTDDPEGSDGTGGDPQAGLGADGEPHAGPPPAEAPRVREPGPDVESRDAAMQAVATGNPEGAARFLGPYVEANPADEPARLELARALVMRGEYEAAEKALTPAGKPGQTLPVLRAHARLQRLRGRWSDAEATLRRALKRDPDALGLRGELLDLLAHTGRRSSKEAIALREGLYDAWDADRVKTPDEMYAVALATLARRSKGGFKDAEWVLGEAEQIDPGSGDGLLDRMLLTHAHLFLENYRPDEAQVSFGQILQRDGWHPDALTGVAQVAVQSLRLGDGARRAEEALQTNPEHPGAHALLARIALIEGRREEARERVEKHTLVVDPTHAEGLAVLAGLAVVVGDQAGYQKWRDQALAHDPHNEEFFTVLADDLSFLHLYPEVASITTDAVERMPEDQFVLGVHGLNLMRLPGREMEGLEAIRKAYKKDTWNERTANTLEFYENAIVPEGKEPDYVDHPGKELSLRLPADRSALVVDGYVAAATKARKALDARYGIDPGKLRLEIYATPEAFSVRTVGVPSLGAVGVCFGRVITSLGPYQGTHNFHQVVWHELAHVYAIQLSKGRVPRWFTEGLSEWESEVADPSWARESADLLIEARAAGRLRKLSELELAFLRAENGLMMEAAYSKAAYAMRYLGQTYGLPKIKKMLEGYATGATTEELFPLVLGKDMGTIEREFEEWFDAELKRRSSGWRAGRPNDDERNALYGQAMKAAQGGKLGEAIRLLEQLVAEGGDGHFSRLLLARLLLEQQQAEAAKKHLEASRKFNVEAVEPLTLLVEVARRQDDVEAEKGYLEQALAIDAMSFEPAGRLVTLALATKDTKRFALAVDRANAIAPLHPISLAATAHRLAKAGKKAQATPMLAAALEQLRAARQGPGDAFFVASIASETLGDAAAAKEMAGRAKADPKLPAPARKRLGD